MVAQIYRNTPTTHNVYLVMEKGDKESEKASRNLDTVDVIGDFGSCAAAYNAGFNACEEPYVFLANDDLEFPPNWEKPALDTLKGSDAKIVGVNEGHDRMTCFSMVERAYILEHSGVYDKPATLCHPYKSQYVDTELADYAKARGVWAEAHDGGVIHRHWEFGDVSRDHPNYLKAASTLGDDHATYTSRKPQWEAAAKA
jgi:glycosyltransferase involved in cell wall biosynthesis